MATLGPRHLVTSAVLIVPMLLLWGCGDGPRFLQKTPLSGPSVGLGRFEGRWFDREGHLLAVVDGRRAPELSVWLPQDAFPLGLEDAYLRGDQLLFRAQSGYIKQPIIGYLRLTGEDLLQMGQAEPVDHVCGNLLVLPHTVLIRNPSSAWILRRSATRNARLAKEVCRTGRDAFFDRLARIL